MVEQLEKANPEDYEKIFADMWQVQQDREEVELYGDIPIDYKFNENNPFANEKNPLQTTLNLANQGRTREAILALESHLQKHPNDVNSWRLLGKLHQENDQDRVAVACLLVIREISRLIFLESYQDRYSGS
jgi:Cytochrome c biogenesis factor